MLSLLLTLVVVLVVAGLIYWAVNQVAGAFGLPAPVVTLVNVALVIVVVLVLLSLVVPGLGGVRLTR